MRGASPQQQPELKRQRVGAAAEDSNASTQVGLEGPYGRLTQLQDEAAAARRKASGGTPGKVCVECGATQTPQWREGPAGGVWMGGGCLACLLA